MVLLALGPPLIAIGVWSIANRGFPGVPLALAVISFAIIMRARSVGRSALAWILLLWVAGYAAGVVFMVVGVETIMLLRSLEIVDREFLDRNGKALAVAIMLSGIFAAASLVVLGAGRPIRRSDE
jgi:hypothetical protein